VNKFNKKRVLSSQTTR